MEKKINIKSSQKDILKEDYENTVEHCKQILDSVYN